jgi:hypothetical protein
LLPATYCLKSKQNLDLPGRALALHRDRKLSVNGLFG